jgi:hypothetical protein
MFPLRLSSILFAIVAAHLPLAKADIGVISFWVPELYALLEEIQAEGNPVETHIYGGRKFYVTKFKGHNVVAVNTGVGISNSAATTATLLQKFPSINRLVGSGIAGGVVRVPAGIELYRHMVPEWRPSPHSISNVFRTPLYG